MADETLGTRLDGTIPGPAGGEAARIHIDLTLPTGFMHEVRQTADLIMKPTSMDSLGLKIAEATFEQSKPSLTRLFDLGVRKVALLFGLDLNVKE